jgi:hypothetical protein
MTKDEFLKLVTPVATLVEKKSEDYQSAVDEAQGWVVKHDDYFPFGRQGGELRRHRGHCRRHDCVSGFLPEVPATPEETVKTTGILI